MLFPFIQRFWESPSLARNSARGDCDSSSRDILSIAAMGKPGKVMGVSLRQQGFPQVGEGDTGLVALSASVMGAVQARN